MKTLGLALVLILAASGCSSGSGGPAGAGGVGGEGGMGGFGGFGGFGGTGGVGGFVVDACLGARDQTIQCENDVLTTLTACTFCAQMDASCPPGVTPGETSLAECLNIALGLSFECATCYSELAICSASSCSTRCDIRFGGDAGSCVCFDCLDTNCDDSFETCAQFSLLSGVPACPGAPECTP